MAPSTSVHSIVWTQVTKISYRWSRTVKTEGRERSGGVSGPGGGTGGTTYSKGGMLTAPWMVPGGTNYSSLDSPGGPLLGGTTFSMTCPSRKTSFSNAIITQY